MNGTRLYTHKFFSALNFQCIYFVENEKLKVREVESEREVNIPNLRSSDKGFVQECMKARSVQLLEMVFRQ